MNKVQAFFTEKDTVGLTRQGINRFDVLLLLFIFSIIFFLTQAASQMATPYQLGDPIPLSLNPLELPFYALRTLFRLFIALGFSLIATFILGALAAKNRRAEQIIIPAIDVLQSVPVLSFLSITITGFIHLFPGSLLGPECAAIFVIFTAQVWNMAFGFYQSLITVPSDLQEAAAIFQLSAWQRFWKVEVPFSMSSLLWNMMMSMSASWFFVVLSEAISVAHQTIQLPGLGSYIALAIAQHNLQALLYAMVTMMIIIFMYDQIFFRPLVAWSEKFKMEDSPDEVAYQSWLVNLIRRSRLMGRLGHGLGYFKDYFINARLFRKKNHAFQKPKNDVREKQLDWCWTLLVSCLLILAGVELLTFILKELSFHDVVSVLFLGAATGLRVIILVILSSLIWIPVGVLIGLRPRLAQRIQPIIQFVAAFPANLFYPLFVIMIVTYHLNVEIWITPLMILGTQWYILFNVIAGALNIPRDLVLAGDNLGLKGWLWWKRLALPAIFPYYITGAISAAGGAWNASIVAEWVSWGDITLKGTGLGAYIQESTLAGNFPKIALGTTMMCLYVLAFNHIIWRPLYRLAQERF